MLGLSVSICKRNSFNPYIKHLVPYYTKSELIKLGQNMDIIDQNINLQELVNYEIHFDICKKVSFNDVSFNEILKHHNYIIKSNSIGWICFYSFFGSFLFNKFLRSELPINSHFYHGLKKIINMFQNTPVLDNDYYMYRFIWDDKFLDKLSINDIFVDYGFMSTTRDPFYSPGLYGDFGLILLKIKIPKNKVGIYMGIFNFFITLPQIVNGIFGGFIVKHFYNGQSIYAIVLAGFLLICAAVSVLFVYDAGADKK
jgi:hypothetical protein